MRGCKKPCVRLRTACAADPDPPLHPPSWVPGFRNYYGSPWALGRFHMVDHFMDGGGVNFHRVDHFMEGGGADFHRVDHFMDGGRRGFHRADHFMEGGGEVFIG